MPTMQQFYLERAAEAKQDADAATLVNVRARFLAAATTWTGLAARAGRVDKMIAGQLAQKRAAQLAPTVTAWRG